VKLSAVGEVRPAEPTKSDAKLKKATAEFEAILLSSWLEKMRESYSIGGSEPGLPGGESMTAVATQAVAQAVAARGGIGIGSLMYEKLRQR